MPSIERNPSLTCKWLFERDKFNNELILNNKENKDFDSFLQQNMNQLPGPGSNTKNSAFEWNLELIRDGIESVIQVIII